MVPTGAAASAEPWKVLVVDDDPEVHAVTRLALGDFEMDGRPLQLLIAMSGAEAREVWRKTSDIALVLLDVVMESEHAGFDFVHFVRDEMKNPTTRIVLRTGQPGQAPALEVMARYEIDDYRTKTELTFERLIVLVSAGLRTYRLLRLMDERQRQLEISNRELERFAYVVSHDLQAPLRSIIGFGTMLQQGYADSLSPQGREMLAAVQRSAQDMGLLIRDLLEYSRVGRTQTPMTAVSLDAMVDSALRNLQAVIAQRDATIERGPLPTIMGNATLLTQLFTNLIGNAIKFQPGPHPWVRIEARDLGSEWELRVSDRGIGIEAKSLNEVFEPFRRLHSQDEYPGTGIGLGICRRVVEVHGGQIHAESEPGQGTTMVISLAHGPAEDHK